MLKQKEQELSNALIAAADALQGLPELLGEDHNLGVLCGLYAVQIIWSTWERCRVPYSRQIRFHAVLSQLWFHISQQSLYPTQPHPPGLQSYPQAAQWGGLPVSTQTKSKQGPHLTSIRSNGIHYGLVLKRATVGLDLSQESVLNNAAVPRKAKCDTANHCLNKQQNSSV